MASFDLREEFQSLQQDPSNYEVVNEQDISAMDERTATGLLEGELKTLVAHKSNPDLQSRWKVSQTLQIT